MRHNLAPEKIQKKYRRGGSYRGIKIVDIADVVMTH